MQSVKQRVKRRRHSWWSCPQVLSVVGTFGCLAAWRGHHFPHALNALVPSGSGAVQGIEAELRCSLAAESTQRRRALLLAGLGAPCLQPPPARAEAVLAPKTGPTLPDWAQEVNAFPGGFFTAGVTEGVPVIRWLPIRGAEKNDLLGESIVYPEWLAGSWKVRYTKKDIRFPQGWGVISSEMPGVRMGSILRLPNVGNNPTVLQRFTPCPGGAKQDWANNLPAVLEAFWPKAQVQKPAERRPEGWSVTYASPLSGSQGSLTTRTVSLQELGSDAWKDPEDGSFLSVEWVRQKDDVQGPDAISDYKVLTVLRRGADDVKDGPYAIGLFRVAVFLRPLDGAYIEANGSAVAVYDYELAILPDTDTPASA